MKRHFDDMKFDEMLFDETSFDETRGAHTNSCLVSIRQICHQRRNALTATFNENCKSPFRSLKVLSDEKVQNQSLPTRHSPDENITSKPGMVLVDIINLHSMQKMMAADAY